MAEEQQPSLVGQEISGCEILQKVAMGGMGSVYKARHKALDRIVCVKILSPSLTTDKKAVELFLTEARAIAEIDHPNIVQVYNVGKEKGYYFIVMGFVEGQTLSQLIKRQSNIPLDTILNLFEGILLGLDAAHAKGIIHRDIKPSNILINADMQPKIVDFGIAKKVDREKGSTKTTELAGTAYFIAPEQALGRDLDTRADLYSVGASLYYVLTGQFPYNGKNTIDIIQKHINEPIPDPAEKRPNLPAWLTGAVKKLMAKKPEDRFQTAKEAYVFFQKMRADEQLRVAKDSTINLVENTALRLVKEEKFQTDNIQRQRQAEKQIKQSSGKPSMLPSVDAAVVLPNATTPQESRADEQNKTMRMATAEETQVRPVYNPAPSILAAQIREKTRKTAKFTFNFVLKFPIFVVFTIALSYIFYRLGVACSPNIIEGDGVLMNLFNPFLAEQLTNQQILLALGGATMLLLAFVSASVKEFAYSTMTLFFLAIVSYMAGLFSPDVAFLDMRESIQFLFTPEYYLCYLVVVLLWAISYCFTFNRTTAQSIFGSVLTGACLLFAYLAAHLSVPPAMSVPSFHILFYVSLFSAVVTIYYLSSKKEKSSVFMPTLFLVIGTCCMWIFMTSGLLENTKQTLYALTANIDVRYLHRDVGSSDEVRKELNFHTGQEKFVTINKKTNISEMDPEVAHAYLTREVHRIAPDVFTAQTAPFYVRMLSAYYRGGGEDRMNVILWNHVLTFPIENFNYHAKTNGAYAMFVFLLMGQAICFCLGALVLGESEE